MPRKTNRPKKNQPFTVAFVLDGATVMKVDERAVKRKVSRSKILRETVEKSFK